MAMHLVVPKQTARDRIEAAEWHALDRRLAVARLKEELTPRVNRWKLKRLLVHLWRDLWSDR